ncbi:hypothetical protein PILCRDRAFT_3718 [Piloderma croceum F 1598]|uniref:Uncharacterized protein n=1 Tax=Piloderma croceum (strain F 1598) TaxID=765440 RepID=A0A0C3G8C9_PILCF|nr:hypothetical protein PILCRDRAFT_3718 [Piloderma croceum F 1598]
MAYVGDVSYVLLQWLGFEGRAYSCYIGQISRVYYACPCPDGLPGDACYETLKRQRITVAWMRVARQLVTIYGDPSFTGVDVVISSASAGKALPPSGQVILPARFRVITALKWVNPFTARYRVNTALEWVNLFTARYRVNTALEWVNLFTARLRVNTALEWVNLFTARLRVNTALEWVNLFTARLRVNTALEWVNLFTARLRVNTALEWVNLFTAHVWVNKFTAQFRVNTTLKWVNPFAAHVWVVEFVDYAAHVSTFEHVNYCGAREQLDEIARSQAILSQALGWQDLWIISQLMLTLT